MSFVIGSLHPPSIIKGCIPLHLDRNYALYTRGNEILLSAISDNSIKDTNIFQIFGEIESISKIDEKRFAVLMNNESVLFFKITKMMKLKCIKKCSLKTKIGKKVGKPILQASNNFVISHFRNRTINIIDIEQNECFMQYLPYTNIFGLKFLDNHKFILVGNNINMKLEMSLFAIENEQVILLKSIELDDKQDFAYLLVQDNMIAVSYKHTIIQFKDFKEVKRTNLRAFVNCLSVVNGKLIACDSDGVVFVIPDLQRIGEFNKCNEIISIGDDMFFLLSEYDDALLLYYENKILKVADSFAQLNSVNFMDKSNFIMKNGKLRSFLNGSETVKEIEISLNNGKRLWNLNDKYLVVSTFTKTIILDDKFQNVQDLNLSLNEPTINIFEIENTFIQITKSGIYSSDKKSFKFENEAIHSSNYGNFVIVSYADRSILLFEIKEDLTIKNKMICNDEISYISQKDNEFSIIFWTNTKLLSYSIPEMNLIQEKIYDTIMLSSIIYDSKGKLIIGGYNEIFDGDNKININSSIVSLRKIFNSIYIVSDTPCFYENSKIKYISSPNYSIDSVEFLGKISVLTPKGISLLSIKNKYHSHVEDYFILNKNIKLMAIDELNKCPIVFAVCQNSNYSLVSTSCSPVNLKIKEIPTSMIWISIESLKYLVVGCSNETSGIIIIFDSKLNRKTDYLLSNPIDGIIFAEQKYIVVAQGQSIVSLEFDENGKLKLKSSIETRIKCASLTCVNSFTIIYADICSSVIIFTILDGILSEICRDRNPKPLQFAKMISNTDILAIGSDSSLYNLVLENETNIHTKFAYAINNQINTILSTTIFDEFIFLFVNKNGRIGFVQKNTDKLIKLYKSMSIYLKGLGYINNIESHLVEKNDSTFDIGKFIDGDFILLFETLTDEEKEMVSKYSNMKIQEILDIIQTYKNDIDKLRNYIQTPVIFT